MTNILALDPLYNDGVDGTVLVIVANRAGPFGVLQTLADGIKLFFKEQSIPVSADRPVFRLAPYLSIMPAFLLFCVVPIGGTVSLLGHQTFLQVGDLPLGALFLLA